MSLVGLGRAIEQVRIGDLGQVTNRWSRAFNSKDRSFAELIQTSPNETSGPLVGNLARTYAGSRGRLPDIRACCWMRDTSEVSAWIESVFGLRECRSTALAEINRIQTRQRFNEVVKTGSPGFIPQGR
jgi:hypothetical protein